VKLLCAGILLNACWQHKQMYLATRSATPHFDTSIASTLSSRSGVREARDPLLVSHTVQPPGAPHAAVACGSWVPRHQRKRRSNSGSFCASQLLYVFPRPRHTFLCSGRLLLALRHEGRRALFLHAKTMRKMRRLHDLPTRRGLLVRRPPSSPLAAKSGIHRLSLPRLPP
jgi:hypothetical protein